MSRDLKWIDAIKKVLEEEKESMHYSEIADRIVEKGYRKSVGATPANTVTANISMDLRDNGKDSEFIKVAKGIFNLRDNITSLNKDEEQDIVKGHTEGIKKYTKIIQAFGISWNRNQVLWKSSPDLLGVQTIGATPVNFAKQIGIYLLHDGREIIYIGQAISQTIGQRVYQHTKDRLSGRWNRFSWFGFYSVDDKGKLNIFDESSRTISIDNIGNTLEAILIESFEPRQNRKTGNNLSGLEYNQHEDPEIERKKAQRILDDLRDKL